MDTVGALIDLARNNRADVERAVEQFGGIGNVLQAAPSLMRIMMTVAKHRDPVKAASEVADTLTLYYDDVTRDKVRAFQHKHGLKTDGIVGERTWRQVEKLLTEK